MARFKDNNLSGTVGTLVFYTVEGQNRVRSKPGKRRKKRGQPDNPNTSVFGKVSANGSLMLQLLKRQLLFRFTLDTYNNARGWMRNQYAANVNLPVWDTSTRPNDMCQLNPVADLRDMLFTSITINDTGGGKLLVGIPAMNPLRDIKKLPAQTTTVMMKLAVLYSPFNDRKTAQMAIEQYSFDYANTQLPAKDIIIDTKAPAGNLAIVVLALEPFTAGKSFDKTWLPAAIIGMGRLK